LLIFTAWANAQWVQITIEKPFVARRLSGIVVDPSGAPVSRVVVEQCDELFSPLQVKSETGEPLPEILHGECDRGPGHIVASTTTDEGGRFAFPNAKTGKTYYLHLNSPGFDPLQITVKLRHFSRARLRIRLYIAT
jgi:hypothetical protein